MIHNDLKVWIREVLGDMVPPDVSFVVESPSDRKHGDYSTNIAMVLAKHLKKSPLALAHDFAEKLASDTHKGVEKVEAVAPGFINFFLKPEVFGKNVHDIVTHPEIIGKSTFFSQEKFFIEHTQPNPFKEFHIGHLMNNAIGESLSRIIKAHGADLRTASYHGDKGLHVAKAVWAILQEKKENDTGPMNLTNAFELGQAYARGSRVYEENEEYKKEIIEINKKIYDGTDTEVQWIYDQGMEISLRYFESLYTKLDSHFDFHFYESESGIVGKKLVLENLGTIFEESEGAVVFKGENFDPKTHTRVFLNKEKIPTYEAKEVGLAQMKKEKFAYTQSLTVTANEQDAFFNVVEVAIGQVFPEVRGKLRHISHGMLRLPSGKMSSRTGSVVLAETLISDITEKVLEKMKEREMSEDVRAQVAGEVAVGALKYSILKQTLGKDIIFDFEKSLSFEGDSGPYLQYAVVRASSILKKAQGVVDMNTEMPDGWQTTDVEKILEQFPSVIERAGLEYAPHYIVTYLTELASTFNAFYAHTKIIDETDPTSPYKLALAQAFVIVMTRGLDLLGISVPSEM